MGGVESATSMLVPLNTLGCIATSVQVPLNELITYNSGLEVNFLVLIFDLSKFQFNSKTLGVIVKKLHNLSDLLIHTHCTALHAYLMSVAFLLWFQCYVVCMVYKFEDVYKISNV